MTNEIQDVDVSEEQFIQEKHRELIEGFDQLERLFKTTQLVLLKFQTSILNEYRYCARAVIDFQKADTEKAKRDALARAEVAISAAYNDIVDYLVDGIKQGVNGLYLKYWDRPVKPILEKYGFENIHQSLKVADNMIIETRQDRTDRLAKYIDFAKSDDFSNLCRFALDFYSLNYELEVGNLSGDGREKALASAINQALSNPHGDYTSLPRFELYLQPKFKFEQDAEKPTITGAEALIRLVLTDETGKPKVLAPDVFLKIGFKAGMTNQIDQWVIDESIIIAQDWNNRFKLPENFDLSINISPVQMAVSGFAAGFRDKVLCAKVDHIIAVELLEDWGKGDGIYVSVANQLNELGAKTRVHIDDFGTGTTKLSYISRTSHLTCLKIDRGIVAGLSTKSAEKTINLITGILSFAKINKLDVVAEGVESDVHLNALRLLKIDYFQGYHDSLSKPAKKIEIEKKYLSLI